MKDLAYLTPFRLKLRATAHAEIARRERLAAEEYAARAASNAATYLSNTTSMGERAFN